MAEEFHIIMRILSFKCLLDSWKAKIGVASGISALLWKKKNCLWYVLNTRTPERTLEM